MERKVTCLWKEPLAPKAYRTGVSLHSHTNHSKETLDFIGEYIEGHSLLRIALALSNGARSARIDFDRFPACLLDAASASACSFRT